MEDEMEISLEVERYNVESDTQYASREDLNREDAEQKGGYGSFTGNVITKAGENDKGDESESICNLFYKKIEYGGSIGEGTMVSNGKLS